MWQTDKFAQPTVDNFQHTDRGIGVILQLSFNEEIKPNEIKTNRIKLAFNCSFANFF